MIMIMVTINCNCNPAADQCCQHLCHEYHHHNHHHHHHHQFHTCNPADCDMPLPAKDTIIFVMIMVMIIIIIIIINSTCNPAADCDIPLPAEYPRGLPSSSLRHLNCIDFDYCNDHDDCDDYDDDDDGDVWGNDDDKDDPNPECDAALDSPSSGQDLNEQVKICQEKISRLTWRRCTKVNLQNVWNPTRTLFERMQCSNLQESPRQDESNATGEGEQLREGNW